MQAEGDTPEVEVGGSESLSVGNSVEEEPLLVFLDFKIGEERVGRVVIELFKNIAPRTCENFRMLCTGEKGLGEAGHPLHYKGSFIHKAKPSFMIQGGDITNFDGTGGETIYGQTFEDESFEMKMLDVGIVGMVNLGEPDTNTSQFFIALAPFPHLQGKNVAFGKVRKGLGVVEEISNVDRNDDESPVEPVEIIDSGVLVKDTEWGYAESDGLDQYPPYPEDWEVDSKHSEDGEFCKAVKHIKETGNSYFKKKNYSKAIRKYKKAIRYVQRFRSLKSKNEETQKKAEQQYSACVLNMAAANLKLRKFRSASYLCNEVIQLHPDAKAFFRRGQANFGLQNYDAALDDLRKAQEIEPSDKRIQTEVAVVKRTIRNYKEQEKERFANILK